MSINTIDQASALSVFFMYSEGGKIYFPGRDLLENITVCLEKDQKLTTYMSAGLSTKLIKIIYQQSIDLFSRRHCSSYLSGLKMIDFPISSALIKERLNFYAKFSLACTSDENSSFYGLPKEVVDIILQKQLCLPASAADFQTFEDFKQCYFSYEATFLLYLADICECLNLNSGFIEKLLKVMAQGGKIENLSEDLNLEKLQKCYALAIELILKMHAEAPEITEGESLLTILREMPLKTEFPSSPTDLPPFSHFWFHHLTPEVQIKLLGAHVKTSFETHVADPLKNLFSLENQK